MGRMKKSPDIKEISVDLLKAEHTAFKALCELNGSNITDTIRNFVHNYIRQHRGKLKSMTDNVVDDRMVG